MVTKYGAKPCKLVEVQGQVASLEPGMLQTPKQGSHDCYPAITAAIADAHKAGGGRVVIPEGVWYIKGPLVLRSNVHVHLAKNARLMFSANPDDYAKYGDIDCGKNGKLVRSRWQGNDFMNFSPLVYAHGQKNIALTGEDWTSVLDGQGGVPFENKPNECWWDWKGRGKPARERTEIAPNPSNAPLAQRAPGITPDERALIEGPGNRWQTDSRYLPALSEAGIPARERIFGHGHFLRPCMVELIECENVLLQGYHIVGAPFWVHHPVASRNVHFKDVNSKASARTATALIPRPATACWWKAAPSTTAMTASPSRQEKQGHPLRPDPQYPGPQLRDEQRSWRRHARQRNGRRHRAHLRRADRIQEPALGQRRSQHRHTPEDQYEPRRFPAPSLRAQLHAAERRADQPGPIQAAARHRRPSGQIASGAGAVITIDCDYAPADDAVRNRPPQVSDIEISGLKVSNVATPAGKVSCYQAMVLLGPVASSYNGAAGAAIAPITRVKIRDCDFGTPRNTGQPWLLHNVRGLVLDNVTIGEKRYSGEFSADA